MTGAVLKSEIALEAKLVAWVYLCAILVGFGSAFVTAHTGLKIVTSGSVQPKPILQSAPVTPPPGVEPRPAALRFGFPDPVELDPFVEPIADAVAQSLEPSHSDYAAIPPHIKQFDLGAEGTYLPSSGISDMALSASAAQAERRVAFVVGNGTYKNVAALPNPPIDAKAMAGVLRNVGFEVVEGTNLTRDKMTEKLLDFGKKAQGADVAVFFYAGHGIAISGTNYLLPVDADIKSEMDVKRGAAINIDLTLAQTMSDAKVKLVFLDACRDNPFAAKIKSNSATRSVAVGSGLAEMKAGEGTLIAFATGPGQTALDGQEGTNSPFTRALIANIATPGVEIQQAMTKVRAQVNEETNKGQLPWGHTNLIGSVFLNGAPAPATAGGATAAPVAVASAPGSDVELEFWRSIRDSNKVEELNAYIINYPNGQFKPLALSRIAALETGASTAPRHLTTGVDPATFNETSNRVTEEQIGLDKAQRRHVQRRLNGLGFDTKVTGTFDENTRAVITRWQAARGYPASGFLNRLQHKAMLSEIVVTTSTASSSDAEERPARHRSGGGGGGGGGGGHRGGGGDPAGTGRFVGGILR